MFREAFTGGNKAGEEPRALQIPFRDPTLHEGPSYLPPVKTVQLSRRSPKETDGYTAARNSN